MTMATMARNLARARGLGGSDSKFFTTTKKGETHELRQELNDQRKERKRDAVKKVIANMTVGKDVSMLFTDVVNCMQTGSIELKKLVYLYLINYSKSNPDLAILAVNTFVKDANDPNPLIRALAIRTMGCIRVERITEYLCEPLRRCLTDDDPYVRKTAAICVAKMYDINPEMVEDQGFLEMLRDLICDSNPTVVANAIAALSEISEGGEKKSFKITTSVLQKLLAALNECTEWGQVFILDSLAQYSPSNAREAEGIIERVTPRLQHANSAVVLSAVKVIMGLLEVVDNDDLIRTMERKMAPPLVTLLSTEPEIQYVALRNINLIVQRRPTILAHEIKVFFCKYNDPIYVKMEKLEIIIRLVSDRNIDQVLLELKEYATEVDVDFVRRSVRAIGRCAIKLERAAEKCINVLLDLIQTKVNYVVQEAITVIKDIFRKYPNRYERIISVLCENLETLDEPEAKASMIWIIGEYAERIENADELLEAFMDSFHDETAQVQLQLLTAVVKLFLKRPGDTQEMVQKVLSMATEDSDNPDLRDRGYIYWRLLSTNPQAARTVVLAERPTIKDDTGSLEESALDQLMQNIATLASVYHKPPDTFVVKSLAGLKRRTAEERESSDGDYSEEENEDDQRSDTHAPGEPIDLLDMGGMSMEDGIGGESNNPAVEGRSSSDFIDDFLHPSGTDGGVSSPSTRPIVITAEKGNGVQVGAQFERIDDQLFLVMDVTNGAGQQPLGSVAIQLNKTTFGLTPVQAEGKFEPALHAQSSGTTMIPISVTPNMVKRGSAPSTNVQAAMKNMTTGVVTYFDLELDLFAILTAEGKLDKKGFISMWKSIDESKEVYHVIEKMPTNNIDAIVEMFGNKNVFYIARRSVPDNQEVVYFSMKTMTKMYVLLEVTFTEGAQGCKICLKMQQPAFVPILQTAVEKALTTM